MKNLLILGASRSGKSTLAKKLSEKYGYHILPIDALVSAFAKVFPELGIYHSYSCDKILAPFIAEILNVLAEDESEQRFIVEGCHVFPSSIINLLNLDKCCLIVVAYPQQSVQGMFDSIRRFDNGQEYTVKMSDNELLEMIERNIAYSQKLQACAKKEGLLFIDTSKEREKTLETFLSRMECI